MYSLSRSFWSVPERLRRGDAAPLGGDHGEGQQDGRRGVDGHRDADRVERQAVEERLHVGQGADRHADPPDLALGLDGVGVVAHLGRQVEGHREAGLALLEQVAEALVGVGRGREAGVLAHRPEAAAIHRRLDAAGEGELAGPPEVALLVQVGDVGRGVEVADLDLARGPEVRPALGVVGERPGPGGRTPAFAAEVVPFPGRVGRAPARLLGAAHSITTSSSPSSTV